MKLIPIATAFLLLTSFALKQDNRMLGRWTNCKTLQNGVSTSRNRCNDFIITKDYITVQFEQLKGEVYSYKQQGDRIELISKGVYDKTAGSYIKGTILKVKYIQNGHYRELDLIDSVNNTTYILGRNL